MRGPLPGEGCGDCACGDVGSSDSPDSRRLLLAISDATESSFSSMLSWMLPTASNGVSAKRCMIIFASRFGAAFAVKASQETSAVRDRVMPSSHELARMVNETVSQVRDISRTLHPVELESGELQSAIEGLADRMKDALPCEFIAWETCPARAPNRPSTPIASSRRRSSMRFITREQPKFPSAFRPKGIHPHRNFR